MRTPQSESEFTPEWAKFALSKHFEAEEMDAAEVEVVGVAAAKNEVQGILSLTYVVDVEFKYKGEEHTKSIFVKASGFLH